MSKLDGLHPYVKKKTEQLLANASPRLSTHMLVITHGLRSKAEQDYLYAQGRTRSGSIVTNAKGGYSMHNFGLAIDFCLVNKFTGKAVWDVKSDFDKDGLSDWLEVVEEAKALGFEWGGDWKSFKDNPHFQMTAGLTDREIYSGKIPVFVEPVEKKPIVFTTIFGGLSWKKNQVGILEVVKPINLWTKVDGKLKEVRVLQEKEIYRVYGFSEEHGGQYDVGANHWVTKMDGHILYSTPSKAKLNEVK